MHPGFDGRHGRRQEGADRHQPTAIARASNRGRQLLLDVKARGLVVDPKLATGDGALGFWKALKQVYPATREQRCWVHKTANVLDKLPKRLQPQAKEAIHQIWMAETRQDAEAGLRSVPRDLRGEVPQGRGVPGQGPSGALGLLRLPGRALDAPADDQPHREHVRHGATAASPHQGQRLAHRLPDDGLQAHAVGRQEMATAQRFQAAARRDRWSSIQRRNQIPRSRRLTHTVIHNF